MGYWPGKKNKKKPYYTEKRSMLNRMNEISLHSRQFHIEAWTRQCFDSVAVGKVDSF